MEVYFTKYFQILYRKSRDHACDVSYYDDVIFMVKALITTGDKYDDVIEKLLMSAKIFLDFLKVIAWY